MQEFTIKCSDKSTSDIILTLENDRRIRTEVEFLPLGKKRFKVFGGSKELELEKIKEILEWFINNRIRKHAGA